MSRIIDDYEGKDDDGPPTRDLKPMREKPAQPQTRRHPDAKTDLDAPERILDNPSLPPGRPICA